MCAAGQRRGVTGTAAQHQLGGTAELCSVSVMPKGSAGVRGDSHGVGTVSSHSSPDLPTVTQCDMEPGLPLLVTGAEL